MQSNLEQLVQDANSGDREALELIVQNIQTPIYCMAFRMLGLPEDAEDAAQKHKVPVPYFFLIFFGMDMSWTGMNFGFMKSFGLGAYGQETITGRLPYASSGGCD
jgi:hypothetical protein